MAERLGEVLLELTPSSQLARIVLIEVDGLQPSFGLQIRKRMWK